MKTIEFLDADSQQITVQHSSGGNNLRVYLEDNNDSHCLHLTRNQARILINALRDLLED